jgi:hypothetical protein
MVWTPRVTSPIMREDIQHGMDAARHVPAQRHVSSLPNIRHLNVDAYRLHRRHQSCSSAPSPSAHGDGNEGEMRLRREPTSCSSAPSPSAALEQHIARPRSAPCALAVSGAAARRLRSGRLLRAPYALAVSGAAHEHLDGTAMPTLHAARGARAGLHTCDEGAAGVGGGQGDPLDAAHAEQNRHGPQLAPGPAGKARPQWREAAAAVRARECAAASEEGARWILGAYAPYMDIRVIRVRDGY